MLANHFCCKGIVGDTHTRTHARMQTQGGESEKAWGESYIVAVGQVTRWSAVGAEEEVQQENDDVIFQDRRWNS